jgi:hypothetical protein
VANRWASCSQDTHLNVSVIPGNVSGYNFWKTLSLLSSHCSEYLQVIQNETNSRIILVSELEKDRLGQTRRMQWMSQHCYKKIVTAMSLCRKARCRPQIGCFPMDALPWKSPSSKTECLFPRDKLGMGTSFNAKGRSARFWHSRPPPLLEDSGLFHLLFVL